MVRNRYLRIERGRWLTEQGMSKNRCGQCGELKRGHMCRVGPRMVEGTSSSGLGLAEPSGPSTPSKLALGNAQPLTMALGDDALAICQLSSPGLATNLSLGISPLATSTPNGGTNPFASLSGGLPSLPGGPPALRQVNSMDILLQASALHSARANDDEATNPFKLPSVKADDLPAELHEAATREEVTKQLNPVSTQVSSGRTTPASTPADASSNAETAPSSRKRPLPMDNDSTTSVESCTDASIEASAEAETEEEEAASQSCAEAAAADAAGAENILPAIVSVS